jgi:4-amino-4-deoxy-L-arabinose transferase-like glycosyltransferase
MSSRVARAYAGAALVGVAAFSLAGLLLAITVPFHDWDSFDFGEWSRRLASGGSIDPLHAGQQGSGRPLYYLVQGALWAVTGVSFTAARILSLVFALVLVAAVAAIAYRLGSTPDRRRANAALAAICAVAVAPLAQESVSAKTDVPAAALVAVTIALALRRSPHVPDAALLALAALAATLTKATAIAPLLGLLVWLLVERSRPWAERVRWSVAPLVGGLILGAVYLQVMAARFHIGLVGYLQTGASEGLWAHRAAADRRDALLRVDVFGSGLRLPLAFALLYGIARCAGVAHRRSVVATLPLALVWTIAGPFAAHVHRGPFDTTLDTLTFLGFAAVLACSALGPVAVTRSQAVLLVVAGLPALALWVYATAYFNRLAATSWPALVPLIAVCVAAGIAALRERLGSPAALVPIAVLGMAVWLALATFDGFDGAMWQEYRSLGVSGVWSQDRTLNIVLPALQSAVGTVQPYVAKGGTVSVSDPRFRWFLPAAQVDTTTALRCDDLQGVSVFILLTSDESEAAAQARGGLATPEEWAKCGSPHLQPLTDGSDGYAIFAVTS